ncbi:type II toxin-antitoxin system RelE/ParE family toxin [Novosphingobium taihuense]|uniref:Toxin ParE1/3/4 n=1 Tax=Novosphingobium taihuense TaxID=260085 RepID=A0A7W7A8S0_9SPHN|nr:type II toxin-antitoxin system RelE/ParE family toxin [Novosphingobium taihuense]MBB4611787.1 toxin ParE1/3/4 [Novosphingobium taihuense]TWH88858.1 toxin ParE1/3/4 [Novosphingobium taihuense]
MTRYRIEPSAAARLDEIFVYTRDVWSVEQAEKYIRDLFEKFAAIAERRVIWKSIPAELGVKGWFCRHERHYVYWTEQADGEIAIVAVLHERMHRIARIKAEFG